MWRVDNMLLTGNGDMVQARCTPLGRQPTNGLKSKRKFKYVWRQMRTGIQQFKIYGMQQE